MPVLINSNILRFIAFLDLHFKTSSSKKYVSNMEIKSCCTSKQSTTQVNVTVLLKAFAICEDGYMLDYRKK